DGDRHQGRLPRRGAQGLHQAACRHDRQRGGHPPAPGGQDLQDRDAGRDRVPRRAAQDSDRQAFQEGAEGRGGAAPESQGQMSLRQPPSGGGAKRAPPSAPAAEGEAQRLYSIGELASELQITTRAIRFYEAKGLISPVRRGRARLKIILRGKNLGFTLEEVAQYLKLYDADPSQIAQTRMLLSRVEQAIADLQEKRADLDHTLKELKKIRADCISHLAGEGQSDARAKCKD